jgi:glycosyltransferase involved in cell wall biosynthesis
MNDANRLKVGFVVPSFDKGGLERVVLELYRACSQRGIAATIFSESGIFGELAQEVNPADLVGIGNQPNRFFAEISARRISCLHYNYSTLQLPEATAAGIRTVYVIHNYYTWLDDRAFADRAKAIGAASAVVAVSEGTREYFAKRAHWESHRIEIVLNGAAFSRQCHAPHCDNSARLPGPHVFANVASFHRVKHHMLLLRAAEILSERGLKFSLLLIGGGGDENYEAEIDARLGAIGTKSGVRKLGFKSHAELQRILASEVDTVVIPSLQEGCSVSALEALALGRPVILTDTGAARDVAAKLPELVTVIRSARDIGELNAASIDKLSRTGDCRNLTDLVEAMAVKIESPVSTVSAAANFPFGMDSFATRHLATITGATTNPPCF